MATHSTAEDFIELERLYADRPAAYRRRVFGLVCLGYGYIAFCLLVIFGFLAGGTALFATGTARLGLLDNFLRIAVPAVVLAGLMLRAFFVRIPAPEGTYLTGALKEKVLAFVEPIRKSAQGRRVNEVVIVNELNAAVQQQARFGLFGPTTNYLILGAPLLQLMSPAEVNAVIAHEFGHLSHEHGRMGATVYRLDYTLRHAAQAIHDKARSGLANLSFKFFDWFYPKFDTVTFAMRRGQEYEADQVASRATSTDALASALCRLHTLDQSWTKFWNGIWARARTTGDNSEIFPQRDLRPQIASLVDPEAVDASVQTALQRDTDYDDTHPCLRDRLAALREEPVATFADSDGAITEIFDESEREAFFALMDGVWQAESGENWKDRHQRYQSADEELRELQTRRDGLSEDELLQLAQMEESLNGREAAIDVYRGFVERFPDSAIARYHWGRLHIEHDLAIAEAALLESLDRDLELMPDVARLLRHGFETAGREEEPASLDPYLRRYDEIVERANAERSSVSSDDRFVKHSLTDDELAHLRGQLSGYPEILKVHLIEKPVEVLQYSRVYVLGFGIDYYHKNVEVKEGKWLGRIMDELAPALPEPCTPFGVILESDSSWTPSFAAFEDSLVYELQQTRRQLLWASLRRLYWMLAFVMLIFVLGFLMYIFVTS